MSKGKRYIEKEKPKKKAKKKLKVNKMFLMLIPIVFIGVILANTKGIASYFTSTKELTNNVKVKAKYTVTYNYYKVSSSENITESFGTPKTKQYFQGQTVTIGDEDASLVADTTNYTSVKFKKDNVEYNSGTTFTMPESNVTIDVLCYVKQYTIGYTLNDGTVATPNKTSYTQLTPTFTLTNPSKTGYTFTGWSGTGLTGTTNTTVTVTKGSTGNRSYTANWTANPYTITYNLDGGSVSSSNPTTYTIETNTFTLNNPTKTGYTFAGWSGTGLTGSSNTTVTVTKGSTGDRTYTANWNKAADVKYAVQIYGINQDVDADGNTLGLTFGPAVGDNYNNKYVTHRYKENSSGTYDVIIVTHDLTNSSETETPLTNSSGDTVTRTAAQVADRENINLHDMTWAEIKAVSNKTVFEDCMLCGDTKSVELTLNSTIKGSTVSTQNGDGAGMLYSSIATYYRRWNPSQSQNSYVGTGVTLDSNETNYGSNARNAGGYSVSHMRATLIGENTKTNIGYAGDVNLTEDTCLYSCLGSDLQNAITAKKIKYVTGSSTSSYNPNDDIADKIWLFSEKEMRSPASYSGLTTEGVGTSGVGYDKFVNTESKYYSVENANNSATNANRQAYNEAGSTYYWWLRSPRLSYTYYVRSVYSGGYIYYNGAYHSNGVAFGFCIK